MNGCCKEKLKSLIHLRTNLFTVVIVLTTGIFGLFFTRLSIIMTVCLFLIGLYFNILFLCNLLKINNDINLILKENEE